MFAIIYPVCSLPLIAVLFIVRRRAKRSGKLESYKSSLELLGGQKLALELFWHLDVIGLILMIAMLACILVPFTLAGGVTAQWKTAKVIAPLVIGVLLVPVWVYWEKRCPHPMLPFRVSNTTFNVEIKIKLIASQKLKDRAIWGPIGIAVMLNTGE